MTFGKKSKRTINRVNIDPDEIFLDSSNLPKFDNDQFEGRIERPISLTVIIVLATVFGVLVLVLAGKAWALQVKNGEEYAQMSENNTNRQKIIFAERGAIFDRNGEKLAWNETNKENPDFLTRTYIGKSGFSHLLGYLKYPAKDKQGFYYRKDFEGVAGLEQTYNTALNGSQGLKIVGVDALGKTDTESTIRPARDGENLDLSIDADIQHQLYESIRALVSKVGFQGGAGALMDVHTGEILALTSYPEYSSNVMTNGSDSALISKYLSDSAKPFLNRFLSGLYTPGSIVKPYVALAALTEKIIDPNKTILSTGSISVPNPYDPTRKTVFMDWKAHGPVDMRKAIAVSSNVYFYEVGGGFDGQTGLGIDRLNKYFSMFGLGSKTMSVSGADTNVKADGDFFAGPAGTIPSREWKDRVFPGDPWRIGDTYFTSIGQYGFQVTPLQMLRAVSSIANDGTLLNPTILKTSATSTIDGAVGENLGNKLPVASESFKIVREGMRQGATTGTASGLNVPYIKVAAKTGTAELGVTKAFVNSWVTGFFPYDNPQYAFVVLMEHGPRTNIYGATLIMRELLDWMHQTDSPYFLQ